MDNLIIKHFIPKHFLALLFLCFSYQVHADEVNVTIKEKGTGLPVEEATVILLNHHNYNEITFDNDNIVYKETDAHGNARFINTVIPKAIKILATGYQTAIQSNNSQQSDLIIYISPLEMEGEGLEVTVNRIKETASKVILSAEELTQSAGSQGDPLKAISSLPGIVSAGEDSAEIYMRGSGTDDNIEWINRAPVGYLYHFGGFQSVIHPKLIKDINLFLGGFPVEYGNALGGVVDAQLRPPKNDLMHYYADISTIASSFLIEGPVDDTLTDSFFVSGRRSYLDALFSPQKFSDLIKDEEEQDPDKVTLVPRFYDFQALYRHQLDKGYLDTYLFTAGDAMAMELRGSAKSDPQLAGAINEKLEFQTTGMTWQQNWNNQWDHIMTLAYYHDKSQMRAGRDDNNEPFYVRVEENTIFWQPELHYRPAKDTEYTFGLSMDYSSAPVDLYMPRPDNENDPDFDFTSRKKYRLKKELYGAELDAYLKYRKQWNSKLTTIAGLNYSNLKISGGYDEHEVSPRASLEYQATPSTLFTASWGRYIQTPDASEIIEVFGNPGLKVTESEHRIIGMQHKFNSLYSLKAEAYHKPMKNLVVPIDENDPPNNYANAGTGEAYGFDLFIKREPRNRKIGWLSLSWAKSERTNELTNITRKFTGDQPLTLTAVWGQPFTGSWNAWDWSVKAQAHSGTPYTRVIGRHHEDPNDTNSRWIPDYGKHNAERMPTYFKVDLRISKEILYDESKLKFYFDIQNITLHKNIVEYDYGNEYKKVDAPTEITGMALFPFFGVEVEF